MFEFEKKRIKNFLFENPHLNFQKYYKQKLDELYTLSIHCLGTRLSYVAGVTMLLPIYLASKHVCYSIQLLNSVMGEILLDPVHLPYDEYKKKFQKLADDFYKAPYDEPPFYYNESEWNRYNFQNTFGDEIDNLFPSFTHDYCWENDNQFYSEYNSGTLS